jgi:hypothetical protein
VTNLVQIAVAGDVAEGEQLQGLLTAAGIDSHLEPAIEHHETALEDAPLKVLVEESVVDVARDVIEALSDPDEESEE